MRTYSFFANIKDGFAYITDNIEINQTRTFSLYMPLQLHIHNDH